MLGDNVPLDQRVRYPLRQLVRGLINGVQMNLRRRRRLVRRIDARKVLDLPRSGLILIVIFYCGFS
jgi:hypothetical protein